MCSWHHCRVTSLTVSVGVYNVRQPHRVPTSVGLSLSSYETLVILAYTKYNKVEESRQYFLVLRKIIYYIEHRFAHILQGITIPVEIRRMANDWFVTINADIIVRTRYSGTKIGKVFRT